MADRYEVTLTGKLPLMLFRDNFEFCEDIAQWRKDPENRQYIVSVLGSAKMIRDDRVPPWTWIGRLFHDETVLFPSDCLQTCLRHAGAHVLVPGSKTKTYKALVALTEFEQPAWPILIDDQPISWKPIEALIGNLDYEAHKAVAADLGIILFAKRALLGTKPYAVVVRPRLDKWMIRCTMTVPGELSAEMLQQIWDVAGCSVGVGDWRPSSKLPGPYGVFTASMKEI